MKQETNAITTAISTNPTTMDSAVSLKEKEEKEKENNIYQVRKQVNKSRYIL